jgi:hypothetical protein
VKNGASLPSTNPPSLNIGPRHDAFQIIWTRHACPNEEKNVPLMRGPPGAQELENQVATLETDAEQQGRHMLNQAQRMEAALAKSRADQAAAEKLEAQVALQSALLLPEPDPAAFDLRAFLAQLAATCQPTHSATSTEASGVLLYFGSKRPKAANEGWEPLAWRYCLNILVS